MRFQSVTLHRWGKGWAGPGPSWVFAYLQGKPVSSGRGELKNKGGRAAPDGNRGSLCWGYCSGWEFGPCDVSGARILTDICVTLTMWQTLFTYIDSLDPLYYRESLLNPHFTDEGTKFQRC